MNGEIAAPSLFDVGPEVEEKHGEDEQTCELEGSDTREAHDPWFFVMRVSSELLMNILESKSPCAVLKWKGKLPAGSKICFMEACRDGQVVATAELKQITVLTTFAELRSHAAFQDASSLQKQSFRNYITGDKKQQEKKQLYAWEFSNAQKLLVPYGMRPFRGRSMWVRMSQLKPHEAKPLPGLDLRETCAYFLDRLGSVDLAQLEQCVRRLDQKVIHVGSTCSGTDVCINVVRATFEILNKKFNVTW